jgi:ACT domain-containing protein
MTGNLAARVEQACQDLLASGQAVTITEVATRSGISRSTLYRRPDLLAVIHEHHQHEHDAFTLTGLAVQIDQLRKGLEALAAKVRRHEEQLRRPGHQP